MTATGCSPSSAPAVILCSRHGVDFTRKLPRIAEATRSLPVDTVLLDGAAIASHISNQVISKKVTSTVLQAIGQALHLGNQLGQNSAGGSHDSAAAAGSGVNQ